ncbi:MAG TPA: hypothetical protein PLD46_02915 [Hyphomicrobium sp.]|nr:hypothetical protein [Hyphomicrobium sp.]
MDEAVELANATDSDIYLYNGEIARGYDNQFINLVNSSKQRNNAILLLVTLGGEPDAGYKISRFLQDVYDRHTVVVSGVCKSAGTLIAIGAHELAFSQFGELGPLDIQVFKTDNLAERQSGLTIQEALDALTAAAVKKHGQLFGSIIAQTNAIVSFTTAAKASAELVNGLFSPIFAQIDPYDVGDKARAMRIATTYGQRLSANTKNLKPKTLDTLTKTYPSHSFVIDFTEATELFNNVRRVTKQEASVIEKLGAAALEEQRATAASSVPVMLNLSTRSTSHAKPSSQTQTPDPGRGKRGVAGNPKTSKRAANIANSNNGPGRG